ncbi:hypothetical protein AVEN_112986-1 [Araneus ventricosus]|uniref:Uncharacterized protein n=1 Tax=Araneus ventricosus TaxID=182803 RepID=A0A4Y2L5Z8_ARAVE|nr:hypothetical protein AVEN_112986-1 [Araneus ventricosus]
MVNKTPTSVLELLQWLSFRLPRCLGKRGVIKFLGLVMSDDVVREWCEKFNTPSVTTDLTGTARTLSSGSGRRSSRRQADLSQHAGATFYVDGIGKIVIGCGKCLKLHGD